MEANCIYFFIFCYGKFICVHSSRNEKTYFQFLHNCCFSVWISLWISVFRLIEAKYGDTIFFCSFISSYLPRIFETQPLDTWRKKEKYFVFVKIRFVLVCLLPAVFSKCRMASPPSAPTPLSSVGLSRAKGARTRRRHRAGSHRSALLVQGDKEKRC